MNTMNKMIQDPRTYLESVGRHDKETVRGALADKGADTILRLCIGATNQSPPVRGIGYIASGLALQEHFFPEARLEVVFPTKIAEKVNGISKEDTFMQTEGLYIETRNKFSRLTSHESPQQADIAGLHDVELPSDELQAALGGVLATEPELQARFETLAQSRKGDHLPYVAAHVLLHDTNPLLEQFDPQRRLYQPEAPRVISIGAQSERPFYLARMACQRAKILPDNQQVLTGQLFTKHVLPPYLSCREGEPEIDDYPPAVLSELRHPVPSVQRDLNYVNTALAEEHAKFMAITKPVVEQMYCVGKMTVRRFI